MTPRFLCDTNILTLFLQQHPTVNLHVFHHLTDEVSIPVIVVEEVLTGWYSALRKARTPDQLLAAYDRLTETVSELRPWEIVPFSAGALARYEGLKKMRLNVRKQDLRIGAIALEWGGNGRDPKPP